MAQPPKRGSRSTLRLCLLAAPIAAWLVASVDDTAPFPRHGEYLGRAACIECHDGEAEAIAAGVHAEIVTSPALTGCESCHGPGGEHGAAAEAYDADARDDAGEALITFPPKLSPEHQRRLCGRCHAAEARGHGGDPHGFDVAGKGCTDCHAVHEERPAEPQPGVHFGTRTACDLAGEPVGGRRCAACHPVRDQLLQLSHHRSLASTATDDGCESCHGAGSRHDSTGGLARLITRPDRARDGIATCRSCHAEVDGEKFHWRDRRAPLLSDGLTCTSCHRVHAASTPAEPRIDPDTGESLQDPKRQGPVTNRLCASCHQPAFAVLRGTIHEALGGLDTALSKGCGSCHAGAASHARAGGKKALIDSLHGSSAAQQMQVCTSCHDREPALRHARSGSHYRNQVGCLACHSPAARKSAVRTDAEHKCATCHGVVRAEFRLPNHHPVFDGPMHCSDCHEPHGARPRIRNLDLREKSCVRCHRQYRGPFVFAHQASRSDGCVVCHSPHGSPNRRMLKQINTQQLCLQCHADFPAFHDQSQGSVFTNCLNCHTRVHGSNHNRFLFR